MKTLEIGLKTLDNDEAFLSFKFSGDFSEKDAIEGIKEWRELFSSARKEKLCIIWDCMNMTGYETGARIAWQKAIKELKKRINCVWLVTDSKVIKTGAKLMNAFTSFKLKVVKSIDQIAVQNSSLSVRA
jgi:hypothetical protein